jgi:hypothetical protein
MWREFGVILKLSWQKIENPYTTTFMSLILARPRGGKRYSFAVCIRGVPQKIRLT